jgi:hypothetical protein
MDPLEVALLHQLKVYPQEYDEGKLLSMQEPMLFSLEARKFIIEFKPEDVKCSPRFIIITTTLNKR